MARSMHESDSEVFRAVVTFATTGSDGTPAEYTTIAGPYSTAVAAKSQAARVIRERRWWYGEGPTATVKIQRASLTWEAVPEKP